jgi:signal transduction histidine kinase
VISEPDVCGRGADTLQGLVHDLRSPLAAISAQAQLLARRALAGACQANQFMDGLNRIEDAARRMEYLLEDLAQLDGCASVQPGPARLRSTDLVDLARRIGAEITARGASANRVVLLPSTPEVVGHWDPVRLERLVANLLENALKYSSCQRVVLLDVAREDDQAVLAVSDQGIGIPPDEVTHVFDRFYRATNVADDVPGTGLGLAGARSIVEQHGGTIGIESALHIGTTVTVRLPIDPPWLHDLCCSK